MKEIILEFKNWPKIPRLENETYTITEKIDGTNACIIIQDDVIAAQSRTRIITPENDNYGFAQWVEDNKSDLLNLGDGYHYGEWWGAGIQRGYGIKEKRFSLFNFWQEIPKCCFRVPVFSSTSVNEALEELSEGSKAAPGWPRPEGLVITSKHYKTIYKVIIDK